ncbi:hypothetical protein GLOIN_2v1495737 [Rhizophagus irregularis DAOM 181602=DAOM 197198]|uniref:Uncharacterized protein n=1 Tax=Rhizophagus irregularis (strain DAOM 181602 / DAOM 197198 / MUCL 43194) TaxID=747089 RepID=A0A2P4QY67_RHIID|nr:hypothetical protein GLOIN_2v1495737 [Rhizophagus irregularis DAOM 181602=DAOM 197198]POG82518.1 hypothetical protein GLOIN_2v1495737 [Rhizophagus irregularis DAOM 181602=DAOM 197198]|eukprot:XP_025189384.1 hypothetical protein GLOIN_2v1495737 [Rhizophagus irregularis DAOM 181602=DAOM 197198]
MWLFAYFLNISFTLFFPRVTSYLLHFHCTSGVGFLYFVYFVLGGFLLFLIKRNNTKKKIKNKR